MDFQTTLSKFLASTRDERGEDPRLNQLARPLLQLAKSVPKDGLDAALTRLAATLDAPHPQVAGFVALIGGCFVEDGADPRILIHALLPRLQQALPRAIELLEASTLLPEVDSEAPGASGRWLGNRLISEPDFQRLLGAAPRSAQSFLALDNFCRPLIAALSLEPSLLKTPLVQLLGVPLSAVSDSTQFARFLARLLRVPVDEPWLVIDPRAGRGFALRVSGVANAFQVYALVHAALSPALSASLAPAPPEHVLSVARGAGEQTLTESYVPPFTLFRWSAVKGAKRIPDRDDTHEWYSNSAVPAELSWFEAARVGVIGDIGIKMELGVSREFGALAAHVTLERELEATRVAELLRAFAATPHPGHPVPGVGWP